MKGGTGTYTLTISLSTIVDDHGDSEGDATAIGVGADVGGELEYDGDFDYFRFQAEAGWSYQIDVALGTLDDSIVELYDADGSFLDSSADYEGTYASRLSWHATSSGEKYVFVGGYGTGTYTLTVSHSTIVDDHGNDYGEGRHRDSHSGKPKLGANWSTLGTIDVLPSSASQTWQDGATS